MTQIIPYSLVRSWLLTAITGHIIISMNVVSDRQESPLKITRIKPVFAA